MQQDKSPVVFTKTKTFKGLSRGSNWTLKISGMIYYQLMQLTDKRQQGSSLCIGSVNKDR